MAFRRSRFLSFLPLVGLLWLTAACTRPDSTSPGADAGPLARNVATATLLPARVAQLPAFDVETYERLLTQLQGTPVVVNVWASWCGPCEAEAPILREASRAYGDRIQFLGVDILDSMDGARSFIADHGLAYPSVFDTTGAIRDSLGMIGQPVTVFYDANGRVAKSYAGQLSQAVMDDGIRAALG